MRLRDQLMVGIGLLLCGAVAGVLVVMMLDPACGPGGDSQKACADEIVEDVKGGRR